MHRRTATRLAGWAPTARSAPTGRRSSRKDSPCSWPQVHTAQNVLACLNACSTQWCLSVPAFAGKFRRCGQLDGRPDLSGLQKIPPGAVGQTNGVGPPACVRTWPGGPGDTRASNPRPTDYRPSGLDSSGCFVSSVVPQSDQSFNGSGQNRTIPVVSGSLASDKRQLTDLWHRWATHRLRRLGE